MSNLLGSAEWSTDTGHRRYDAIGQDGGPLQGRFLLLGESREVLGNLHVRAPRQHVLTIAQTRSGKGVSLIIPNLLNYLGAVLVVDPKGENAWLTAPFRSQVLRQKTYIVDPWGEVNRRYGSMSAAGVGPIGDCELQPALDSQARIGRFHRRPAYLADALIITQRHEGPVLGRYRPRIMGGPHGVCRRASGLRATGHLSALARSCSCNRTTHCSARYAPRSALAPAAWRL
jgi:hypothetical protein